MKAVLPNMDGLHSQVKSALENTAESELRADAIKVHEALLVRPTHTCTHTPVRTHILHPERELIQ